MVEELRDMVVMATILLSQKEGDVGQVVERICSTLRAPHMDGNRIRTYFGRRCWVGRVEVLERISPEGVPAEIQTGGNLKNNLMYGNNRSVVKYLGDVLTNAEH